MNLRALLAGLIYRGKLIGEGSPNKDMGTPVLEAEQEILRLFSEARKGYVPEKDLAEARYMGAQDFVEWILRHDESSFRQERAWFKIKPGLLLRYQAELMEGLKQIRSSTGKLYTATELAQAVMGLAKYDLDMPVGPATVHYLPEHYLQEYLAQLSPTQPQEKL